MQLISLTANKNSFKPVVFKSTGINLIIATQKNPDKSDKGDTTNGVGKSLLIALIHFCLGSSTKKAFKESLPDWEFSLKFKIKQIEYTSTRNTDKQNKIVLNGEELSTKEFNNKLEKLVFEIPDEAGELSFRSLLAFFIRPTKSSYIDEKDPNAVKKPFHVQMINAYLLGLDVLIAQEKHRLKLEKDRIRDLVKNLRNDNYLKDFFTGKKDVSLSKQELSDKIEELEYNLKNFNIADDYYEIKEEADQLKRELEKIHQQLELIKIQIENIDESRKISPDIERTKIEQVYKEASIILQDQAVKQLSELEKFYEHLSRNREKRLLDQKNELLRKANSFEIKKNTKSEYLDGKLKYLDAHQALDMFTKLSNNLSDLKSKKENLEQYEELLEVFSDETRKIKKLQLEESEKAATYLKDASEIIAQTNDFFRFLVKSFYPNAAAGITIHNNEGDNQIRFDIDAKIEFDKSDGIGNVKTFCYDLTLLLKGFGHNINFLFHDSRLLEGIDPRQKHELFLVLQNFIEESDKQYILTANYNQLEEIKPLFKSEDDYKRFVDDNTILELKDSHSSDKLLGIQVDMDYE